MAKKKNITLRWPVDSQRINQGFGKNPDFYKPFGLPGHEGIDFFASTNANVYACADGEVFMSEHPKDHPYGLHVRIRHEQNGVKFKTVYAHLNRSLVKVGQQVKQGDLIGKADNTGNSFGSHLHFTLKIEGDSAPGYPGNIVDPTPYLKKREESPPPPSPDPDPLPAGPASGVFVYTTTHLNMRSRPTTNSQVLTVLPIGERVEVLGDAASESGKIGKQDQWLQVRADNGLVGHVAAWFVRRMQQAAPSDIVVYAIGTIDVYGAADTSSQVLGSVSDIDALVVLGDTEQVRPLIGVAGKFLSVQAEAGLTGFVAADRVRETGQAVPASDLVLTPTFALNLRARPTTDANILTVTMPGDRLQVLGNQDQAAAKIGKSGAWINVRSPSGYTGYVAAEFVAHVSGGTGQPPQPDPPQPGLSELFVYPNANVNVRAQASVNSPRVGGAWFNEKITVAEADLDAARDKVGRSNSWVHIQLRDGTRGWILATLLSLQKN